MIARSGSPGAGERGVTLIELLIAVSLVGLLSVGMLMAMRVGLNALERTNSRLIGNRRIAGAQRVLDQQIAGMIPVLTRCGDAGPDVLFFQGEPQAMRLLSNFSMEEGWRGYPRILEYTVIAGENGQGVRLVVNELPYHGPLMTGMMCAGLAPGPAGMRPQFRPVEAGPASFVLADRLAHCRFAYLHRNPRTGEGLWAPEWLGGRLPMAVRIEMAALEPEASRLPLTPVTIPIRVDREPMDNYEDLEQQ